MPIHNRPARSSAAMLAVAALLGGCAAGAGGGGGYSGAIPSYYYYDNSFSGNELGYMEQFSPIPVYVRSSQITSQGDIQAAVGAMNGAPATGRLRFVPATAPSANGYSIVLLFGPSAGSANACPGRADLPVPPGGGGQLTGVFCLGPRLRSTATIDMAGGTQSAVARMTTILFSPDTDPGRRRPRSGD